MNHNSKKNSQTDPQAKPIVVRVGDLMKQITRLTDIRRKVQEGYYDRPEVLAEIADEIRFRLKK